MKSNPSTDDAKSNPCGRPLSVPKLYCKYGYALGCAFVHTKAKHESGAASDVEDINHERE